MNRKLSDKINKHFPNPFFNTKFKFTVADIYAATCHLGDVNMQIIWNDLIRRKKENERI